MHSLNVTLPSVYLGLYEASEKLSQGTLLQHTLHCYTNKPSSGKTTETHHIPSFWAPPLRDKNLILVIPPN